MKKYLIICLSALFIFACAAFTACDKTPAGENAGIRDNGGSGETNDKGDNADSGDNKGDGSGGREDNSDNNGDDASDGTAYVPVYDKALPANYFGTYYLSEHVLVEDGVIVKTVSAADQNDPESEFSTAKYNVTVLNDNVVYLNFGGRADKKGVFSVADKTLKVDYYYFSSLNTVEKKYGEIFKFEFLNGELVLLKESVSGGKQILRVYKFKKGESLTESDYPVDINSFDGTYKQKHSDNVNYIAVTLNGGAVKIKTYIVDGSVNEYDGVALLRADGDGYKVYFRYNGSADLRITFDYALNLTTQDYEKVL